VDSQKTALGTVTILGHHPCKMGLLCCLPAFFFGLCDVGRNLFFWSQNVHISRALTFYQFKTITYIINFLSLQLLNF
jgi:hypothetical protein